MSDLIDREALRREIYKDMAVEDNKRVVQLLQAIMDAPAIDAVPVVRCKDCKHSTTFHHTGNMYCGLHENHHFLTDAYGFCHKGERRCENE